MIPVHPIADLFPPMEEGDFRGLVSSIKANGLREPIVTWQGRVIDGRHRQLACAQAGVESAYREWDGKGDMVGYVVALNLHRRHLDASQRAMVADRVATYRQGERTDLPGSAHLRKVGHADAARAMSVSKRSVESASVVRDRGIPELAALVDAGQVKVSAAEEVARLPEPEQQSVVKAGPGAVRVRAAERRTFRKSARRSSPQARGSDQFWVSIMDNLREIGRRGDAEEMSRLRDLRDSIDAALSCN